MPKAPAPLTVKQINALSSAGRHRVSDGLYLRITPSGSRYWDARITVDGKRTWRTIGDGSISAQIARRLAMNAEPEITNTARKFSVVWSEYIERHGNGWKSAIHHRQWAQTGRDYILPMLADRPIDAIRPEHVVAILAPLWLDKHESARRIRGRIELVIDYEFARLGLLKPNAAEMKLISKLLPRHRQEERHHPAPTVAELAKLLASLGDDASHQCLRWLAMTACRTSEARFATVDEVVGSVWTIPASKMKSDREHRVVAPWQPTGEGYLFQYRGHPLSLNAMRSILVKRKIGWTVHGIRSTFSSWATEQGFDSRLIESQLAHSDKDKVRAAYARSDLFEQRREMIASWRCLL